MSTARATSQSVATKRLGGGVNAVVSGRQPSTAAPVLALDVQTAQRRDTAALRSAIQH